MFNIYFLPIIVRIITGGLIIMKFLVTGGAGFIGSNYLHYVVNKYSDDYFVCLDAFNLCRKL